ncbi:hypothetical protein BJQ96_00231 [Flavobacterium sp. PL0002]|nr:hypothetical protein [Flavobacterium sp. PL002]
MKVASLLIFFLSFINVYSQTNRTISRDWISFNQAIDIQTKKNKKFKIVASVKVASDEPKAWAGVWARENTKNGENGFFDNMNDRQIKLNQWQSYTVEGTITKNSKTLTFGGICSYNGKFYFDKFELFIENDKGVLEAVAILNPSFELVVNENEIPKWNLGTANNQKIKVKEFVITSSDVKSDGNYGLLIEGNGIKINETGKIGNIEGASPQIGAMISMLEDLKNRVELTVKNMDRYEIDYLHDDKANRIGALIMHLAAAEAYYQVYTFENREFNEEEKKKWEVALDLDKGGQNEFKGHDIQYYLDIFDEVRAKTITELKKRDDAWFAEEHKQDEVTNQYCWFHVMEHQSGHLGQILFLKKRIPPELDLNFDQKLKN